MIADTFHLTPSAAVSAREPHLDAALLQAWADLVDANRRRDAAPDDLTNEEYDPYDEVVFAAEARVRSIPARTPEGLAVKLRWLWCEQKEVGQAQAYDVIFYGAPIPPDLIEDWRDQLFWSLIADAERMST